MPWHSVLAQWPNMIEHLCADFRHLEEAALRRFRGDREKMVVYLAETHDLTIAEAEETLAEWFARVGRRIEDSIAA